MKRCRLVLVSLLVACGLGLDPGWAQQPKSGGTLRIALPGDPAFYNAHQGPMIRKINDGSLILDSRVVELRIVEFIPIKPLVARA
jgi:hypothetical protein